MKNNGNGVAIDLLRRNVQLIARMDTIASAGLMLFIYFMIYWISRDI